MFFALTLMLAAGGAVQAGNSTPPSTLIESGIAYTNYHVPEVPWSVHVVRVARSNPQFEIHSAHGGGGALGLGTLSDQVRHLDSSLGTAVAAINGDFYHRDRAYAGDPRGLQLVNGEIISAPTGGACFWIDALGQPHATNVSSQFQVSWPNGKTSEFGLNEERRPEGLELYTPAAGASTRTSGGQELILERHRDGPWLPLRMGKIYQARIREIHDGGDTPLAPGLAVLSLGPSTLATISRMETGAVLTISTASLPGLRGAKTAIGGGPVLVRDGKKQKLVRPSEDSYEFNSMMERHPRSAIGWNQSNIFLVEVDGRQRSLSVGMTLDELSAFLVKLGCEEAMNLDGGGSAALWYDGRIQNSPCDGHERAIANSLIVVKKPALTRPPEANVINPPP